MPELVLVDPERGDLRFERLPWNSQLARGPDPLALPGQGRPAGEPGGIDRERIALAQDDRPLDDVLQLADVARPTVGFEQIERRLLDVADLLAGTSRGTLHQVFHQQRNVVRPVA